MQIYIMAGKNNGIHLLYNEVELGAGQHDDSQERCHGTVDDRGEHVLQGDPHTPIPAPHSREKTLKHNQQSVCDAETLI